MYTRCDKHTADTRRPALCHTCQRIGAENRIVTRAVDALLAAGHLLNVDNGGDTEELPAPTDDRAAVLAVLMETDLDKLRVYDAGRYIGFVFFVYGNDGYDVINDYTTNLETVLEPVNAYAETLEN